MTGAYKRSKFQAEQVALEFARAGLPVVIVNPTAPIGDHDFKPTPTGKIVLDFLKGDMPAFVDTGLNLVDVEDTAEGHILACERGRAGERYILGCENLTLQQILERLAMRVRPESPALADPLRRGLRGRSCEHRLGEHDRSRTACAAGRGQNGS